jgi:adenylate cyclase
LLKSPLYHVAHAHEWLTLRLDNPATEWPTPDLFRDRNLTELLVAPLLNAGPLPSVASFATRRPMGFSGSERALLEAVVPALRSASELKLLRLAEATLLATYLGSAAGQRILAGPRPAW